MDASTIARLKELEKESLRLKKRYAEERLKAEIVAEALQNGHGRSPALTTTAAAGRA